MADTKKKKKTTQSTGKKNTGTGKNAGKSGAKSGAKSSSKPQSKQAPVKSSVTVQKRSANREELAAIIVLAVVVFFVFCMFGKCGKVGDFLVSIFYGVLGFVGTVLVLITLTVLAISFLRGTTGQTFSRRNTFCMICFYVLVTSLLHVASSVSQNYLENEKFEVFGLLKTLYTSHMGNGNAFGGGIIAGGISTGLIAAVTQVGAYVILVPLTIVFSMLLFKYSLYPFFTKAGKVLANAGAKIGAFFKRLFTPAEKEEKQGTIRMPKNLGREAGETDSPAGKSSGEQPVSQEQISVEPVETETIAGGENGGDPENGAGEDDAFHYSDEFFLEKAEIDQVIFDVDDEQYVADLEKTNTTPASAQAYEDRKKFLEFTQEIFEGFDPKDVNPRVTETVSAEGTGESPEGNDAQKTGRNPVSNGTPGGTQGKPACKEEEAEKTIPAAPEKAHINDHSIPVLNQGKYKNYVFPSPDLLNYDAKQKAEAISRSKAECEATKVKLVNTLKNFGVECEVTGISVGPTVTRYEIVPRIGVKMESIRRLSDELAFYLAAETIRIEAPIPGKSAVGIEVPNKARSTVYLKEIITCDAFKNSKSSLASCVGKDILGTPIIMDIEKMPHLLIAGTTGSGKSVFTNAIILSLLFKSSPDDVRLILVDPKVVEFSKYNGIPHLLLPVVTDAKKAASALSWAVQEMDKRYAYFAAMGAKDIFSYNELARKKQLPSMPRIVIVIDELADLMMVAKASVETAINRIAQKARACGMHLVVATQRPSVDVVTGLIKSNIASRVGLRVANSVDSRIILEASGCEKLLGKGDMIYAPSNEMKHTRVQCGWADDESIEKVVEFITGNSGDVQYDDDIVASLEESEEGESEGGKEGEQNDKEQDREDIYRQALRLAMENGEISTSFIQRQLKIGYNRAADITDRMIEEGIIEKATGGRKCKVIKKVDLT